MSEDRHQHHGHCQDHGLDGCSHDLRGTSRRNLTSALVLIVGFMFAEIIGGILSGSLALMADAGHMLTDAASIGLALVALHFSTRPASARRTFGYRRLEILAALLNAVTLWLIAAWVVYEAYHRFTVLPDVKGEVMLTVGSIGLVVNLIAARILHRSAGHSVNVEGAYQHVMADLLGSIGVVVSGILVWGFNWKIADPIVSVIIGILILVSSWRLLGKVIHVLLEGVPQHIDIRRLCRQMEDVPGVGSIHDIHVWSLASDYDVLTAHVLVDPGIEDMVFIRNQLREIASRDFGIRHVTIQLEDTAERCIDENHHVGDLVAPRAAEGFETG
jgi:cobalt-zinc-cadmium efflux system protein